MFDLIAASTTLRLVVLGAIFFIVLGTVLCVWGAAMGPTWNLWQISIAPPDLKYGLGFAPLREEIPARSGYFSGEYVLGERIIPAIVAASESESPLARAGFCV